MLSDGLKDVPVCGSGADGFIAAGMGGKLIVSILTAVPEKTAQLSWCVLSPQSEIWLVRQALTELDFLLSKKTWCWKMEVLPNDAGSPGGRRLGRRSGKMRSAKNIAWQKSFCSRG